MNNLNEEITRGWANAYGLNEVKENWKILYDAYNKILTLDRYTGRTLPSITYCHNKSSLTGRDNNGNRPSDILKAKDVSRNALNADILPGISKPHPSDALISKFFDEIEKLKKFKDKYTYKK